MSRENRWQIVHSAKPPKKFLFFSQICHMPDSRGCYVLGGSDFEDNYSKRTLAFHKYQFFMERAPMIFKRAFFTCVYSKIDNSIYCMGGNDSINDLVECEKYSIAEDIWR